MTKRQQTKIISLCVTLIASVVFWYFNAQPPEGVQAPLAPPGSYHVVHMSDGDTFTVNMNGHNERIRLIGVDTPETKKPDSPVQCFGPQASAFTKQLISNQPLRLEADPTSNNRDRYDRLLRYAYLPDGTLLNSKLIEEGYGFAYLTFPFSKQADFAAAQAKAQDAKKGLWATCLPQLNNGRWRSNNL